MLLGAGILAGMVGSAGGIAHGAVGGSREQRRSRAAAAYSAVWVFDGYWGVGAGVMALAVLTLAVETHFARANALKNVLLGVADVACSIVFALYGPVRWAAVVPLALGVLTGSRMGPALTRRIPRDALRVAVSLAGLGLAVHLWLSLR